jgi:hypothetical protein
MSELTGEVWYLPSPDSEGTLVFNGHPRERCTGYCVMHSPSSHAMRDWPMRWEWQPEAGGRMMRRCPHGKWHDDPDDRSYRVRQARTAWVKPVPHECCATRCCRGLLDPWPVSPSVPF